MSTQPSSSRQPRSAGTASEPSFAVAAAAGKAFVAAAPQGSRWTIGNAAIAKTLVYSDAQGLHLAALEHRTTRHTWQPNLQAGEHAGGEFTLEWDGAVFSARSAGALHAVHAAADEETQSVTLAFDLRLGGVLDVTLHYRAHDTTAVIEQWLTVTPPAQGSLRRVAPATIDVSSSETPVLHWVRGLQNHGHYTPAKGPYPAYQVRSEPLHPGAPLHLHSGLRSTWHEIAWLALDGNPSALVGRDGSEGLFLGLLYSGRWSAAAESKLGPEPQVQSSLPAPGVQATQPAVSLSLASEGYVTVLEPRTPWRSPSAFLGVYQGDLDAAAHAQHDYLRAAVIPPTPDDFPWVQYNTWFAHLVDIDEEILRPEADLAARLGAEVFVIDAGWWEPSRRTSDNFTTGLGIWRPSAEKFPSGLKTFADYVRSLGMRFGIWVEPERVDMRQPGTWRLDWLVRHNDAIVSPPWPPDTVSGWLCYGHPDVQAWAIEWISSLVTEVGAEWLKWDSNWWGVCTCANHHHGVGDGEFHQVQGVHVVLAELRKRFPNLRVENCAGGGARTDFAMLANTHATWLHDSSTPSRRVRFHLAGAAYLFPPALSNTFVVDSEEEPLTDPSTPRHLLDAIARSRMLGAYGVSARLPLWTDTAFAAVGAAIAEYKRLRPLLKYGRFYHLLPQADLQCPDLPSRGQWEAYALVGRNRREGAVWVFKPLDSKSGTGAQRMLRLRGLDPGATYRLLDLDTGRMLEETGEYWMDVGLVLNLQERSSALVRIDIVDQAAL